MELSANLRAMRMFGFIVPDGSRVTTKKAVVFTLSLLPCFLLGLNLIYKNATTELNFKVLIVLWFHVTATFKALFRRGYFWYKKRQLEDLIATIEAPFICDTEDMNLEDERTHARSARNIARFSRLVFVYTFCNALLTGYLYISKIVAKTADSASFQSLILQVWFPFDPQRSPDYQLLMLWQMYVDFMYLGIVNTPEALMCSLMMGASERADMLSRVAPSTLTPGPGGEVTAAFRDWVKYHLHYLSIVRGINDSMGLYIFLTYAFSLINIIIYSFLIIESNDPAVYTRIILNLVGLLMRHYVYAASGHMILHQSLQLRSSVVSAAQVSQGALSAGPACSALQVVSTRVCGGARPEEVTGLGFFGVTMEMFTAVLSASFSNLLVVLEFNKLK